MKQVNFKSPPINEVVFGVLFDAPNMTSAHYGLYWNEIKNSYKNFSEKTPVFSSESGVRGEVPFMLPRVWYETENNDKLIQLQSDRFYYNWRQSGDANKYKRFNVLLPEFIAEWGSFSKWLSKNAVPLTIKSLELTYINHIDLKSGWSTPADNTKVFNFLDFSQVASFKPLSNAASCRFDLGEKIGTLNVSIKQGKRNSDSQDVLVFELTVKKKHTDGAIDAWYTSAHDAIIESFLALTNESAHNTWGIEKT